MPTFSDSFAYANEAAMNAVWSAYNSTAAPYSLSFGSGVVCTMSPPTSLSASGFLKGKPLGGNGTGVMHAHPVVWSDNHTGGLYAVLQIGVGNAALTNQITATMYYFRNGMSADYCFMSLAVEIGGVVIINDTSSTAIGLHSTLTDFYCHYTGGAFVVGSTEHGDILSHSYAVPGGTDLSIAYLGLQTLNLASPDDGFTILGTGAVSYEYGGAGRPTYTPSISGTKGASSSKFVRRKGN